LREKEIARFPRWLLFNALISPRLELHGVEVESQGDSTWSLRLTVQNTGWLPSYVSKMTLKRELTRGVLAEIALPEGAQLVGGKSRESLGELEGWAYLHTGVSFWGQKKPTADRAHVDWVIRAPAGSVIELSAWHDRAGRIATRVTLGN
jgi:hypothetical protein